MDQLQRCFRASDMQPSPEMMCPQGKKNNPSPGGMLFVDLCNVQSSDEQRNLIDSLLTLHCFCCILPYTLLLFPQQSALKTPLYEVSSRALLTILSFVLSAIPVVAEVVITASDQ